MFTHFWTMKTERQNYNLDNAEFAKNIFLK